MGGDAADGAACLASYRNRQTDTRSAGLPSRRRPAPLCLFSLLLSSARWTHQSKLGPSSRATTRLRLTFRQSLQRCAVVKVRKFGSETNARPISHLCPAPLALVAPQKAPAHGCRLSRPIRRKHCTLMRCDHGVNRDSGKRPEAHTFCGTRLPRHSLDQRARSQTDPSRRGGV